MKLSIIVVSSDESIQMRSKRCAEISNPPMQIEILGDGDACLEVIQKDGQKVASALIVDQYGLGPQKAALLYQKLRAIPAHRFTPLVVIDAKITPVVLGMASEYRFFRIIEKNGLDESLKFALEALVADLSKPSGLRQSFNKMSLALANNEEGEANRILEECYQLYKNDPDVLVEYGNLCLRKGRIDRAEKVFNRLASEKKKSLRVSNFLARVQLKLGKFSDALSLLDQADVLSPNNLERLILMGDAFRLKGEMTKAEQKYEQALWIEDSNSQAKKGLGLVSLEQGEVERALDFFKETCLEEEIASFLNNTAVLAVKRAHFQHAKNLYSAAGNALTQPSLRSKIEFNLGLLHRRWRKLSEASQYFEKAIELDPQNEKAMRHLSLIKGFVSDGAQPEFAPSDGIEAFEKDQNLDNFGDVITIAGANTSFLDADLSVAPTLDYTQDTINEEQTAERAVVRGKVHQIDAPVNDLRPFSVGEMNLKIEKSMSQKLSGDALSKKSSKNGIRSEVKAKKERKLSSGFIDDEDE